MEEAEPLAPEENLRRREGLKKKRDAFYRAKSAAARLTPESQDKSQAEYWEGWDGQDILPVHVPLELLIPDAYLHTRKGTSQVVRTDASKLPALPASRRAGKTEIVTTSRRQLDAPLTPRPAFSATQHCPYNWVGRADTCYYFAEASWTGTWDQCASLCAGMDATMPCITSQEEDDFIHAKIAPLAAAAGANADYDIWVGMRNSDNAYAWVEGCTSEYVPSFVDAAPIADGSLRCVSMRGAGGDSGKWKDAPSTAKNHCVCEHSFRTAASVAKRHAATTTSVRASVGTSVRPSTTPRTTPGAKPAYMANITVPTGRFETEGARDWFLNLPQIGLPGELFSIASMVYDKVGCAANNKCNNQWLWFQSFKAPYFPVLTVIGNQKYPCTFATVINAPQPVPAIPGIEIGISSSVELSFCNDFSALDYLLGSVTISVAVTGVDYVYAPFDEIISWQVVSVGMGITFLKVDFWCEIDGSNNIQYSDDQAYSLLRRMATQSRGPAMCRCLRGRQTYPGLLNTVGGPDIPLIIFATMPPFIPLAPFLYMMRIRESVTLETYPHVCELAIARTTMTIELHLNMGIYVYTVTVINFAQKHASKSGSGAFVGAYSESPRNADMFLDQAVFMVQRFEAPFTKAVKALQDLLSSGLVVWSQVLALGGNLANAAKAYFQSQIEGGQLAADAVGAYARDLYRLFKPQPVTVSGCFDPYITQPECDKKVKLLGGKKVCVRWTKPELRCGSTSKCIKYCN
jgi:hypothetical protein